MPLSINRIKHVLFFVVMDVGSANPFLPQSREEEMEVFYRTV